MAVQKKQQEQKGQGAAYMPAEQRNYIQRYNDTVHEYIAGGGDDKTYVTMSGGPGYSIALPNVAQGMQGAQGIGKPEQDFRSSGQDFRTWSQQQAMRQGTTLNGTRYNFGQAAADMDRGILPQSYVDLANRGYVGNAWQNGRTVQGKQKWDNFVSGYLAGNGVPISESKLLQGETGARIINDQMLSNEPQQNRIAANLEYRYTDAYNPPNDNADRSNYAALKAAESGDPEAYYYALYAAALHGMPVKDGEPVRIGKYTLNPPANLDPKRKASWQKGIKRASRDWSQMRLGAGEQLNRMGAAVASAKLGRNVTPAEYADMRQRQLYAQDNKSAAPVRQNPAMGADLQYQYTQEYDPRILERVNYQNLGYNRSDAAYALEQRAYAADPTNYAALRAAEQGDPSAYYRALFSAAVHGRPVSYGEPVKIGEMTIRPPENPDPALAAQWLADDGPIARAGVGWQNMRMGMIQGDLEDYDNAILDYFGNEFKARGIAAGLQADQMNSGSKYADALWNWLENPDNGLPEGMDLDRVRQVLKDAGYEQQAELVLGMPVDVNDMEDAEVASALAWWINQSGGDRKKKLYDALGVAVDSDEQLEIARGLENAYGTMGGKLHRTVERRERFNEKWGYLLENPDFEAVSSLDEEAGTGKQQLEEQLGADPYFGMMMGDNWNQEQKQLWAAMTGDIGGLVSHGLSAESSTPDNLAFAPYVTDDQRKMLRYVYKEQGAEAALSMLGDIMETANERRVRAFERNVQNTTESSGWAAAGMSAWSWVTNVGGSMKSMPATIINMLGGKIDPNDPVYDLTRETMMIRGTTAAMLDRYVQDMDGFWGDVNRFFKDNFGTNLITFGYNTGMSIGDNMMADFLGLAIAGRSSKWGGRIVQTLMSSSAAGQKMVELMRNNPDMDMRAAAGIAIFDGLVEAATEKWSFQNLYHPDPLTRAAKVRDWFLNGVFEGSEELAGKTVSLIATEIGNRWSPETIEADVSSRVGQIMLMADANGKPITPEEAWWQAVNDWRKEACVEFASGAFAGWGESGGAWLTNKAQRTVQSIKAGREFDTLNGENNTVTNDGASQAATQTAPSETTDTMSSGRKAELQAAFDGRNASEREGLLEARAEKPGPAGYTPNTTTAEAEAAPADDALAERRRAAYAAVNQAQDAYDAAKGTPEEAAAQAELQRVLDENRELVAGKDSVSVQDALGQPKGKTSYDLFIEGQLGPQETGAQAVTAEEIAEAQRDYEAKLEAWHAAQSKEEAEAAYKAYDDAFFRLQELQDRSGVKAEGPEGTMQQPAESGVKAETPEGTLTQDQGRAIRAEGPQGTLAQPAGPEAKATPEGTLAQPAAKDATGTEQEAAGMPQAQERAGEKSAPEGTLEQPDNGNELTYEEAGRQAEGKEDPETKNSNRRTLARIADTLDPKSEAKKYLDKLRKKDPHLNKINHYQLGKLLLLTEAELDADSRNRMERIMTDGLTRQLRERGIPMTQEIRNAAIKMLTGEKLTRAEKKALRSNPEAGQIVAGWVGRGTEETNKDAQMLYALGMASNPQNIVREQQRKALKTGRYESQFDYAGPNRDQNVQISEEDDERAGKENLADHAHILEAQENTDEGTGRKATGIAKLENGEVALTVTNADGSTGTEALGSFEFVSERQRKAYETAAKIADQFGQELGNGFLRVYQKASKLDAATVAEGFQAVIDSARFKTEVAPEKKAFVALMPEDVRQEAIAQGEKLLDDDEKAMGLSKAERTAIRSSLNGTVQIEHVLDSEHQSIEDYFEALRGVDAKYRGLVRAYSNEHVTTSKLLQLHYLNMMARTFGFQVVAVDSLQQGTKGMRGAQGAYNYQAGFNRVFVGMDAMDGNLLEVGLHEIWHAMRQLGGRYATNGAFGQTLAEQVKAVEDQVFKILADNGETRNELIQRKIADYARGGVPLTEDEAADEIVANAMPALLQDEQFASWLYEFAPDEAKAAEGWINRFANWLQKLAGGTATRNREAAAVLEPKNPGELTPAQIYERTQTALNGLFKTWQNAGLFSGLNISEEMEGRFTPGTEAEAGTRYSLVTQQQDDEYRAAVEAGDTQTAQRMVDEAARAAGYTTKAYHGTDAYENFTVFKSGKRGYLGPAIYLSLNESVAKRYADKNGYTGRVYSVYAKTKNPLIVHSAEPAEDILYAAYGRKSVYENRAKKQAFGTFLITKADLKRLQEKGYDSIRWEYGKSPVEIAVFDSANLKSAEPVTRDNKGQLIPLSERFNQGKQDIRWSLAGRNAQGQFGEDARRAEQMAAEGRTDEEIRAATGAIRGYNGRFWRVLDNGRVRVNPNNPIFEARTDYERILEAQKTARGDEYLALSKRRLEAANKVNGLMHDGIGLQELLDAEDLFNAYPFLRSVIVKADIPNGHVTGYTKDGVIHIQNNAIENKDSESIERTIRHEIQHMIQMEEGIDHGANPEMWDSLKENAVELSERASKNLEKAFDDPEIKKLGEDFAIWINENGEYTMPQISTPENIRKFENEVSQEVQDKIREAFRIYHKYAGGIRYRSSMDLYENTVGEIEARAATRTGSEQYEPIPYGNRAVAVADYRNGTSWSLTPEEYQQRAAELDSMRQEMRQDAMREALRQNETLQKLMEGVARMNRERAGSRTGQLTYTPKQMLKLARQIKNAYWSDINSRDLAENLASVFTSMANARNQAEVQGAFDALTSLAADVLDQTQVLDEAAEEANRPLREWLRGQRILLTSTQIQEAKHLYGSMRAFRAALPRQSVQIFTTKPGQNIGLRRTNANLTAEQQAQLDAEQMIAWPGQERQQTGTWQQGTSAEFLDTWWQNAAEEWQGIFDPDLGEGDMLAELVRIVNEVQKKYVDPYRTGMYGSLEDATTDLSLSLWQEFLNSKSEWTPNESSQAAVQPAIENAVQELAKARKEAGTETLSRQEAIDKARQEERQKAAAQIEKMRQRMQENARSDQIRREQAQKTGSMRNQAWQAHGRLQRKMTSPDANGFIPNEMRDAVQALLNATPFTRNAKGVRGKITRLERGVLEQAKTAYQSMLKPDGRSVFSGISSFLNEDLLDDFDVLLAATADGPKDTRLSNGTSSLNQQQMQALRNILCSFDAAIRNANNLFTQEKRGTLQQMGGRLLTQLESMANSRDAKVQALALRKLSGALERGLMTPTTAFERLKGTELYNVWQSLRAAEDTHIRNVSAAESFMQEALKRYNQQKSINAEQDAHKDDAAIIAGKRPLPEGGKLHLFIDTEGKKFLLTDQEMMTIYAYWRRESETGTNHLLGGGIQIRNKGRGMPQSVTYRLNTELLAEIANQLSEDQKRYVNHMVSFLSHECAEWGNEVTRRLYGYDKFTEGFYLPFKVVQNAVAQEPGEGQDARLKTGSFTKNLTANASTALEIQDFTSLWASHVEQMSDYNAFVLPIEDMTRLLNYRQQIRDEEGNFAGWGQGVRQQMIKAYGENLNGYIMSFLKRMNGNSRSEYGDQLLNGLVGAAKGAAVTFNLSVAIQQMGAGIRAAAELNPLDVARGIALGLRNPREVYAELERYAPIATLKSWGYFDTNMKDSLYQRQLKNWRTRLDDAGGWMASMGDKINWAQIWEAVKAETRRQNPGMEQEAMLRKAGERFREVIDKTQVVDSIFQRSEYATNKGRMSALMAFMSEPVKQYNMLLRSVNQVLDGRRLGNRTMVREGTRALARNAAAITISALLTAALKSVISGLRDRKDEKKEEYIDENGKKQTRIVGRRTWGDKIRDAILPNLADNMLGLLTVFKQLWDRAEGNSTDLDASALANVIKTGKQLVKWAKTGEVDAYNLAFNAGGIVSNLMGVGIHGVIRDGYGIAKTIAGGVTDSTSKGAAWDESRTLAERLAAAQAQYVYSKEAKDLPGNAGKTVNTNIWGELLMAAFDQGGIGEDFVAVADAAIAAGAKEDSLVNLFKRRWTDGAALADQAAAALNAGDLEGYNGKLKEMKDAGVSEKIAASMISTSLRELQPEEEEAPGTGQGTVRKLTEGSATSNPVKTAYTARLKDAMARGDTAALEESISALRTEGIPEKQIVSAAKSGIKELYQAGTLDETRARDLLQKYGGVQSEKDLYWTLDEWQQKDQHEGETDYTYSRWQPVDDLVDSGASLSREAIGAMTAGGYTEKEVYSHARTRVKELYRDGKIPDSQLEGALKRYGGSEYTDAELHWQAREIRDTKGQGGKWSRYDALYAALDGGNSGKFRTEAKELVRYWTGTSAKTDEARTASLMSTVMSHYKDDYLAAIKSGNTGKAASIKAKLKNAASMLGIKWGRKQESTIKGWTKSK